jgi:hypothetical protein
MGDGGCRRAEARKGPDQQGILEPATVQVLKLGGYGYGRFPVTWPVVRGTREVDRGDYVTVTKLVPRGERGQIASGEGHSGAVT